MVIRKVSSIISCILKPGIDGCLLVCLFAIALLRADFANGQERNQNTIQLQEITPFVSVQQAGISNADVIEALGLEEDLVISVDFLGSDQRGYTIFTESAAGFPTHGNSYLALSSGCADLALEVDINAEVISCVLDQGPTGPGNATDIVWMELVLQVPDGANTLSFDFKFFSEEFPDFIGSVYNDGFVVEVGKSTFTVDGNQLIAPDNVVFDEQGNPITINDAGTLGQNEKWASGTAYGREANGGATQLLTTQVPISPGQETLTLIFSIFDVQDRIYDSTVFIDNVRFDTQELELVGLEVNQAIQDWNNNVILIQDKKTVVRAHLQSLTNESIRPNVRLEASRNGIPLPESPQTPQSDPLAPPYIEYSDPDNEKKIAQRRADRDMSVNFELPNEWLSGTIDLKLVGDGIQCPETAPANNEGHCTVQAVFRPTAIPKVAFYRLGWFLEGEPTIPPKDSSDFHISLTTSMLPIPELDFTGPIVHLLDNEGPLSSDDVFAWLDFKQKQSTNQSDRIHYAFVTEVKEEFGGAANKISGNLAYTSTENGRPTTTAHEFGHIFGQEHAVHRENGFVGFFKWEKVKGYCNETASNLAPDFPYNRNSSIGKIAALGPVDKGQNRIIWGVNTKNNKVMGPMDLAYDTEDPNPEVMSYCHPGHRWISRFTYPLIFLEINDRFDLIEEDPDPLVLAFHDSQIGAGSIGTTGSTGELDYLLVRGQINLSENSVEFRPFASLSATQQRVEELTPDPGDFILLARDEQGSILYEVSFTPNFPETEVLVTTGLFSIPVPASPEIYEVQVMHEGEVIGFTTASPNPPEVSIAFPQGGESFGGDQVTFEWTAQDPDGDELTYSIFYSSDGGASWSVLTSDITRTTLDVDLVFLAGTHEGLLRVQASDGFNTAEDVSGMFSVPNSPPVARILSPFDGAKVDTSATLPLMGAASDLEDGRLQGTSLEWSSSVNGFLGFGNRVDVPRSTLSRGFHTITLKATDSHGATDQASVTIEVTAPTPITLIAGRPQVIGFIPDLEFAPGEDSFTVDLDEIFDDPTGIGLSYEVGSTDENVASAELDGSLLTVKPGIKGEAEINVTATNEEGSTVMSFTVTVLGVPAPQNLQLTVTDDVVELDWEMLDETGIDMYRIYRGETIGELAVYDSVGSGNHSWTDPSLTEEILFYAVTAVDENGNESDFSNFVSFYKSVIQVIDQWDLVSLPLAGGEVQLEGTQMFYFERAYRSNSVLVANKGYWIRSDEQDSREVFGNGVLQASLELNEGWNLIGSLADSVDVAAIDDPEGIRTEAPVFGYDGAGYQEQDYLTPGRGYWIHASDDGAITLQIDTEPAILKQQEKLLAGAESQPEEEMPIRLDFSAGPAGQPFFLSRAPLEEPRKLGYLLPPKAPGPTLDVRTPEGFRMADGLPAQLDLTASVWPVRISLDEQSRLPEGKIIRLAGHSAAQQVQLHLTAGSEVVIAEPLELLTVSLAGEEEAGAVITQTGIDPGYPNPFNAQMTIRYRLAEQTAVRLELYNVIGQRVAVLVDGQQQPGQYIQRLDAAHLASGMYFLQFQAGDVRDIQKLTLIK